MPINEEINGHENQILTFMGLETKSGKQSNCPELTLCLAELARVQSLLDRARDAIFVVSLTDEIVVYQNESTLHISHLPPGESKRPLRNHLKGPDGEEITVSSLFPFLPEGEERKIIPLLTKSGVRRFEASFMVVESEDRISGILTFRDQEDRIRAEEHLAASLRQVELAHIRTVHLTATLVEIKDSYTGKNQRQSASLAHALGIRLGLSENDMENLVTGTLLHDVGMMAIPTEILCIPGPLRPADRRLMQEHALIGSDILKKEGFPSEIHLTALHHHERVDGSGYPYGLKGDSIPFNARIAGLADVVEAMSSHRPYRPAWPMEKVCEELSGKKGILYDADVAEVCIDLLESGYVMNDEWNLK